MKTVRKLHRYGAVVVAFLVLAHLADHLETLAGIDAHLRCKLYAYAVPQEYEKTCQAQAALARSWMNDEELRLAPARFLLNA